MFEAVHNYVLVSMYWKDNSMPLIIIIITTIMSLSSCTNFYNTFLIFRKKRGIIFMSGPKHPMINNK